MAGEPKTFRALCDIRGDVNPDVVGDYLERARQQATDEVSETQAYVELARPAKSPIHKTLEWDDYKLAEAARREQAGVYFRFIVRKDAAYAEGVSIRMNGQHVHYSADDLLGTEDLRRLAVEQLLTRILGDLKNHSYLGGLDPVIRAAEAALNGVRVTSAAA